MPNPQPKLAIDGGTPVRATSLAYGKQWIEDADVEAVVRVLRGDWLTTGPAVGRFESDLVKATGAQHAVAVSNGTAALHAAMHALDLGPGDEVIAPTMTFAATTNAALYVGATPVFADVEEDTLLIDPESVAERLTPRTKAIVGVDFAGQPADYRALREIAGNRVAVVADAAHSLGGSYNGTPVGAVADLSTFSFHPVKHVTTGEGGAITTNDPNLERRIRVFRNHGITTDHRERTEKGSFEYDMKTLGYNYRLTDFQAALGSSQLARLPQWVERRRAIAATLDEAFDQMGAVSPLLDRSDRINARHLYVVQLELDALRVDRAGVFRALQKEGIGVNVHYRPVHLHPYYREHIGTKPGMCPVAEAAYERILSLPMFPKMSDADVNDVVTATRKVTEAYAQ